MAISENFLQVPINKVGSYNHHIFSIVVGFGFWLFIDSYYMTVLLTFEMVEYAWNLFYGFIWFILFLLSANLFKLTKIPWIFR